MRQECVGNERDIVGMRSECVGIGWEWGELEAMLMVWEWVGMV